MVETVYLIRAVATCRRFCKKVTPNIRCCKRDCDIGSAYGRRLVTSVLWPQHCMLHIITLYGL